LVIVLFNYNVSLHELPSENKVFIIRTMMCVLTVEYIVEYMRVARASKNLLPVDLLKILF